MNEFPYAYTMDLAIEDLALENRILLLGLRLAFRQVSGEVQAEITALMHKSLREEAVNHE